METGEVVSPQQKPIDPMRMSQIEMQRLIDLFSWLMKVDQKEKVKKKYDEPIK